MLKPGDRLPALPLSAGVASLDGKRLVVYFFPKSGTPACTMEACAFRDHLDVLREREVEVVGISPDAPEAQAAFAQRYGLTFTLLSDADGAIARAFGTAAVQQWAGKSFPTVTRSTFLVDSDGIIRQVWPEVDPRVHVPEVVAAIRALEAQSLQARLAEARELATRSVESPFASARMAEARMAQLREGHGEASEDGGADTPVDREAVEGVLAMLRPYMQADGGDVELVDIEGGRVKVRLQGACGTCPSATVTLRLGIEAQLKQRVPGVSGVEAVF